MSQCNIDIISSRRFIAIELQFKGSFQRRKGAFKKRKKKSTTKLIIASIYYPYKHNEYDEMIDFISTTTTNWSPNKLIFFSQDSNAQVGIKERVYDDNEQKKDCLGEYSLPHVNNKGRNLINFVRSRNWTFSNTFFEHLSYATWCNFSGTNTKCQIDHIITNHLASKSITNCKTSSLGTISDHNSIISTLTISHRKKYHKLLRTIIKWKKLVYEEAKRDFNNELSTIFANSGNINDFCEALNTAGKNTLSTPNDKDQG